MSFASRSHLGDETAATGGGRYILHWAVSAFHALGCAVLRRAVLRRGLLPCAVLRRAVLLCAVLLLAVGCQNPRREARRAVRTGHWEGFLARYAEMEADRPERLEALRILHEEYEVRRREKLEKALQMIGDSHHKRNGAWVEAQPLRGKELEAILKGNPENMPRVWDHLVK